MDEINQLFLPNMRNKLMWFYQEVDEPESVAQQDQSKPGPSRAGGISNPSKTPQGKAHKLLIQFIKKYIRKMSQILIKPQKWNLFREMFGF